MRKTLFVHLFILFSISLNAIEPIKIAVTLSDTLNTENQWVYWVTHVGNEYNIVDSCFLKKGQKEFKMEKIFSDKGESAMSWLCLSKTGPLQAIFYPAPGEDIRIYLSPKDLLQIHNVEGSSGTREDFLTTKKSVAIYKKIKLLNDSLFNLKEEDSVIIRALSDSINFYQAYHEKGQWVDLFNKSTTAFSALDAFNFLSSAASSKEERDSFYLEMKRRFPESRRVQEYYEKTPPATPRGKMMQQRWLDICEAKYDSRKTHHSESPPIKIQPVDHTKELAKITSYVQGDVVDKLSLKGLNDADLSIDTLTTPYIFIDFWASWCAPCRWEFPHLKKAHSLYKDILTIYAISLDNNEASWRRTISSNKVEEFVHVYGGNVTTLDAKKLMKYFGVEGIPANFLLDKNRKIIATNLRGEALENKMKELLELND